MVINLTKRMRSGDRLCDPGIDEQHVDRAAVETLAQRADAGLVGDVCGFLFEARGETCLQGPQPRGLATYGRDDVPVAATELLDEREAEAARGTDDEYGWLLGHGRSPHSRFH